MLQKEFNAGKQFVKDINADLHANINSDLFFDKTSFDICQSQHKLQLTNSFDSVNSLKENNEFQINLIKQMLNFFNKQTKSDGNILCYTLTMYM